MSRFASFAVAAALLAAPVFAGERIELNDKTPVTISPSKAYVTYRGTMKFPLMLIGAVDDAQRVKWSGLRAAALVKAQAKYAKTKARFDDEMASWSEMGPNEREMMPPPIAPAVLTEANFAFPPPEMDNFIYVGARPYSRAGEEFDYLIMLPPGRYTIYGAHTAVSTGAIGGACLCMGSVAFDAVAGKVVSLGRITNKYGEEPVFALDPANATDPVLPALASFGVAPAHFSAVGKMPNYHGTLIMRLAPIPGVLAYRRDIAVDVASGQDAPSFR